MSNLQEIPQPQGAEERKKIATEHFEAIKSASGPHSRSSLVIGYHGNCLKKANLFGILGFATEEETRQAADVGKATWYNTLSIASAFEGLPMELFIAMKLVNAQAAVDLPDSKRLDRDWVTKAAELTEKQFAKLVDEALNGKARASDGKERTATLKVDMPASRKVVIEAKVKEFAEAHDMEPSDTGKVIEAMAVEATGGKTMLDAILHAVQRGQKIKELCESGLSSDEVLAQVIVLNEEMILEMGELLEVKGKSEDEEAA
jgi:acetolactate synthase small subunit